MTGQTQVRDPAARSARSFVRKLSLEKRGSREYRVHAAPAVSCAKMHKTNAHEHTGSAEAIRHSLRNGFNAYIVLSPAIGFFATVAGGVLTANLTPASRRQDHTILPSASAPFVKGASASIASRSNVRDDRETPLCLGRDSDGYSFDLGSRSTMITAAHWHDGQNSAAVIRGVGD
jgi:hypothetical protein